MQSLVTIIISFVPVHSTFQLNTLLKTKKISYKTCANLNHFKLIIVIMLYCSPAG